MICAISTVEAICQKYGYPVLERVLRLIVGTWEGDINSFTANIFNAVAKLVVTYGDALSEELFINRVGNLSIKQPILLAEDNELNQEIAEAILSEAGFIIEVAGNGQEALDMLKASEPGYYQLVLMDIQMPVMAGYEAARAIRALDDPQLSALPIIAMTANAFEEDKQNALRSGMNGHIAKPIDIQMLFDTLDQVLS